jgi:phosphoribosylpyrophosphate synthetase
MREFVISANHCLNRNTVAYYNCDYIRFQAPGNPDFINGLKNQFNSYSSSKLTSDAAQLMSALRSDLPAIYQKHGHLTVCVIPRAKALDTYSDNQLFFRKTIRTFVHNSGGMFLDGTDYIVRHTNTRTTHLKNYDTDGEMPYKGIAADTCTISSEAKGKRILLIDDIYTATVNIDEDAIQCLYDNGASEIIFYAVAKTIRKY